MHLPSLPLSTPVDWDAFRGVPDNRSAEFCARIVAGQLVAYREPVPAGRLSVIERDTIAIQRGHIWAEKEARGVTSGAWHEISEHFGTLTNCPCAPCSDARKVCKRVA